jgi:tryptophan-rich sensory protein
MALLNIYFYKVLRVSAWLIYEAYKIYKIKSVIILFSLNEISSFAYEFIYFRKPDGDFMRSKRVALL